LETTGVTTAGDIYYWIFIAGVKFSVIISLVHGLFPKKILSS
jgi:hypothetical protein